MRTRRRKYIFGIIYVAFVSFVVITTGEIILRLTDYDYVPIKIRQLGQEIEGVGRTDWRPHHEAKDKHLVYDPNLIWRPRRNYALFNSQGFIGPELNEVKGKYEYRIFAIGDSNTAGHPGWPVYLGDFFRTSHPQVTVINAGVWGYSSWQGLGYLKEFLRYKPDMVLISFGSNDAQRVGIPDSKYVASKRIFQRWILRSRLSRLLIELCDAVILRTEECNMFVPRVSLFEYTACLNEMVSLANENGIKIVLLTRPFIGTSHHELWWKNFAPAYNDITMEVAKKRNVKGIDIYSYFKNKDEYFADESHFTKEVYFTAAKLIYDQIKDDL